MGSVLVMRHGSQRAEYEVLAVWIFFYRFDVIMCLLT